MKRLNILIILSLSLAACRPVAHPAQTISSCREVIQGFLQLQSQEIPSYFQTDQPAKQGGEIDVMDYFSVLDHLSMAPGYSLDYVYHFDGMGGYPVLYARPSEQPPFATEADLETGAAETYLDYIQLDDTPESYFQYLVLATYGGQFYLFWHANYNDTEILCGRSDVSRLTSNGAYGLSLPWTVRLRASLLHDLQPVVTLYEDTAEVRWITFTKWGGFYVETYTLDRTSPTAIQGVREKNIIHYDCGIMF